MAMHAAATAVTPSWRRCDPAMSESHDDMSYPQYRYMNTCSLRPTPLINPKDDRKLMMVIDTSRFPHVIVTSELWLIPEIAGPQTPAGLLIAHDHLRLFVIPSQTLLSPIRARGHLIESALLDVFQNRNMAIQPLRWTLSVLLAAWAMLVAAAEEEYDLKMIPLRTHSLQSVSSEHGGHTLLPN